MVSGHTDVTVIGFSLSSGVAIRLMAGQPVSRLVLVAPYDSVVVVATQQFVLFSVHWPIRDRLSSASMVPSIRALTTVIVAERDEVVRPECTGALAARFALSVAQVVMIAGASRTRWIACPPLAP